VLDFSFADCNDVGVLTESSTASSLSRAQVFIAGALACLAVAICLGGTDEILAEVLAAGFLVFMHSPVRWKPGRLPRALHWVGPAALLVAGNLSGLVLPQALGWVWAFVLWAGASVASSALPITRSWIAFFFLFPWITHDFPVVGWWFRLSGAAVSGWIFEALGFPVLREGTRLLVGGLPVNVEAACAGTGLLQSLLVAGVVLLLVYFPTGRAFYFLLPAIPVLAWISNTARIAGITGVALSEGVAFSQGMFHTWGGLLVTLLMLGFTLALLTVLRRGVSVPPGP
jgi:exosortase/archaeosortase family protein